MKTPYTWVALSPIKATEDMTDPVGQRDGRLYTSTLGRLPAITPEDVGRILEINEQGQPVYSDRMLDAEEDIQDIRDDLDDHRAAINQLGADKQEEIFVLDGTLETGLWVGNLQTVTVTGVRPTDIIIVGPKSGAQGSYVEYTLNDIRGYSQATDTLTFQCSTVPTVNVDFQVMVIRPN